MQHIFKPYSRHSIINFWLFKTYMWPDLPQPTTYACNCKDCFSSPIDSSINKLITTIPQHHCQSWLVCFSCSLFLRTVRHPQVLECLLNTTGWLVQGSHLAGNCHLTCWWCKPFWVQWGSILGHFILKSAEFYCNPALCGSPQSLYKHLYMWCWYKYLKWWEIQLAVHCGVGVL